MSNKAALSGARPCPTCRGKGRKRIPCNKLVDPSGKRASGHRPTIHKRCQELAISLTCETCDGAGRVMTLRAVLALLEP